MRYLSHIKDMIATPQRLPAPGRTDQTVNSAGGYVWPVDLWTRVERFLILGSGGGTYYIGERELTLEWAAAIVEALAEDGPRLVRTVADISESGRAPRNAPALLALAIASSSFADERTRGLALSALPRVARTASELCAFVAFARQLRGWGRGLRGAVASWYVGKPARTLAYQMTKYRERNGWSHRDLLRVAHPQPPSAEHNALFRWAIGGEVTSEVRGAAPLVGALESVNDAGSAEEVVRLIETHSLTHEMIPSRWLNSAEVWEALLAHMPFTALLRNLAKMTAVGVLAPMRPATALAALRLTDPDRIRRSRVHPVSILSALAAYRLGKGVKGGLRWAPVGAILDALDEAFYLAFANAQPTGKRIFLAIDASGSMQHATCAGLPHVTAAMGAAAMAMSVARTERDAVIAAFHDRVWHVGITAKDRLDSAMSRIGHEPRGTDAALPILDALDRRIPVDAFVLITDSETWAGDAHPAQALQAYRRRMGIAAKMVVIAMAANRFSIADPNDAGQLDVVGFDATVPAVIADFIRN